MSFASIELPARREPLIIPWPSLGNSSGFIRFDQPDQWRTFVAGLGIDPRVPEIVRAKYDRAQKLYLLGWIDPDLMKAGELAGLIALELALIDRYGGHLPKRKRKFAAALRYMVEADGLTDAQIPMIVRYGGTVVGQITGDVEPSFAQRRNALAHGDPFDGLLVGGLLELVRDLIGYAYRRFVAEATGVTPKGTPP